MKTADLDYYRNVIKTQRGADIFKAELQDLIDEVEVERAEIKDMIDDKIKKNEQLKENAKMFLQAFLIDIDQNRTEVNKSVKTHANEMVKTINHILTELRSKI